MKPISRISGYFHVQDEIDSPVLPDNGMGDSLLDDLLHTSEGIFHADVTRFQVNQERRLWEYEQTLYVWGDKQQKDGMDGKAIDNAIDMELVKFRQMLRFETEQFVRVMEEQRKGRDHAIGIFSANPMHTESIGED